MSTDPVAGEDYASLEEGRLVVSVDDMPMHDEAGAAHRMVMSNSTRTPHPAMDRCTMADWHAWVERVGALRVPTP